MTTMPDLDGCRGRRYLNTKEPVVVADVCVHAGEEEEGRRQGGSSVVDASTATCAGGACGGGGGGEAAAAAPVHGRCDGAVGGAVMATTHQLLQTNLGQNCYPIQTVYGTPGSHREKPPSPSPSPSSQQCRPLAGKPGQKTYMQMDKLAIPSATFDSITDTTASQHRHKITHNINSLSADHNGNYNGAGPVQAGRGAHCPYTVSETLNKLADSLHLQYPSSAPPVASPAQHRALHRAPPGPTQLNTGTKLIHVPQVRVELADGQAPSSRDGRSKDEWPDTEDIPDPHEHPLMETGIQPIDLRELQHRRKMRHKRKHKFVKNLLILSFGFVLLFSATNGLSLLQSSLNQQMGVFGLCANFAAVAISCLLLPTALIQILGCKWTIVSSMACFVLWIMANLHPTWGTLIPASVVMGTGWAPLWTAQCTYFTVTGIEYAKWVDNMPDVVIARMFGIFFMIFMTAPIWGNLLSSSILSQGPYQNRSHPLPLPGDPDSIYRFCGAADCPGITLNITNDNYRRPDSMLVYTLVGLYLGLSVVAMCLVAFFLDRLELERDTNRPRFAPADLMASLKQVANPYQVFIIPLTVYTGMEQVFIVVEYTRAYTTCALGMEKIGYVVISYAAVAAIMSLTCSQLVNVIGRMPLFLMGAGAHIGCMVVFMRWTPYPDSLIMFIVMPAIWGIGDAIWQSQINAFYGVLFSDHSEAAFSNYRMWESVGFIVSLSYSPFLCVYMKIYILIGALIAGLLGYFVVEGMYSKASSDMETELARKGEVVEEAEKEAEAPFQGVAQLIRRKSSIYIPNSAVREAAEVMRRKSQVFLGGVDNCERVIRRRLSTFVPVLEESEDNSPTSSVCSTPTANRNSLRRITGGEPEDETLEIHDRGVAGLRRNGRVTPPLLTELLLQTPTEL